MPVSARPWHTIYSRWGSYSHLGHSLGVGAALHHMCKHVLVSPEQHRIENVFLCYHKRGSSSPRSCTEGISNDLTEEEMGTRRAVTC